ncbi:MAG: YihY/virulence factor BrkB family protein [Asticcacaulis sp.]
MADARQVETTKGDAKPRPSVISLVRDTFTEWNNDQAPNLGASLAFYSMLSIGPLLLIAVSVAGLVFSHDVASRYILDQIRGLVGAEGAAALETMLNHAQNRSQGIVATAIGVVTLLMSAAGFFQQLQSALNTIFNVPKARFRWWEFIWKRLLSFGMVIGICLMLLSSLVISAGLAAVTGAFGDSAPAILLQAGNVLVSFLISTLLFALAFRVLPDVKIPWRDLWIGSALTAILFAAGKSLIGLYLGRSSFSSTYGAVGSLIVLLVWVYYSAQIIFFGAEFILVNARASGQTFPFKTGFAPADPADAAGARPDETAADQAVRKAAELGAPIQRGPGLITAMTSLIALAGVIVALRPSRRL